MEFDGSLFHVRWMAGFISGDVGDANSQSSESWAHFGRESDWTDKSWDQGL